MLRVFRLEITSNIFQVFSVLRSINRNSYDIGHTKLLRNTLFSTNVLHGNSSDTSNVILNENLANTSQQAQTLDETIQESKTSTENAEVSTEASVGSNTSSFSTEVCNNILIIYFILIYFKLI